MPFSRYFTILTLLMLFFSVLVQEVQGNNKSSLSNYNSSLQLDSPENREDFYMVMSITITAFLMSCIACLYVFHRTYKQWIFNKKSLKMVYRLPFYTSCIDFVDNGIFLANVLHTAIYASVFGQPACRISSIFLWAFDTINLALYVVIALSTYFRVRYNCKNFLSFGKFDHKLWIPTLLISAVFQIINKKNHGPRKYWCSGKSGQILSPILLFCLISMTLLIMIFCYVSILWELKRISRELATNKPMKRKRAAKKIVSYVLVFVVHWIPILIQNFGRLFGVEQPWIYILKSLGHAMGAVGNAVVYVINEGWTPYEKISNISNANNANTDESKKVNTGSYLNIKIEQPDLGINLDEIISSIDEK